MKEIALFVGTDITGLEMANRFIPALRAAGYRPVIIDCETHRNKKLIRQPLDDIEFYNVTLPDQHLIPALEADKSLSTKLKRANTPGLYKTYRQLVPAKDYFQTTDVNNAETYDFLAARENLVGGISFRNFQVFENPLIEYFYENGLYLLNLHNGPLPEYPGLVIPVWIRANGGFLYGLTLHHVNERIDKGNIIDYCTGVIEPEESVLDIYLKLAPDAVEIMMTAVKNFGKGYVTGEPQPENGSIFYYPNPTQQMMDDLELEFCEPLGTVDYFLNNYALPEQRQHLKKNVLLPAIIDHEVEQTQKRAAHIFTPHEIRGYG